MLESIFHPVLSNQGVMAKTTKNDKSIKEMTLANIEDLQKSGFELQEVVLREIEIAYQSVSKDEYIINDETEGTYDDWRFTDKHYNDATIFMVKQNTIIGFVDVYPIAAEYYQDLVQGKVIIRENMIAFYEIGGTFDAFIGLFGLIPDETNQRNLLMMFDWVISRIIAWKKNGIVISHLGIVSYCKLLDKLLCLYGFTQKAVNKLSKGRVYEVALDSMKRNKLAQKRYPEL